MSPLFFLIKLIIKFYETFQDVKLSYILSQLFEDQKLLIKNMNKVFREIK